MRSRRRQHTSYIHFPLKIQQFAFSVRKGLWDWIVNLSIDMWQLLISGLTSITVLAGPILPPPPPVVGSAFFSSNFDSFSVSQLFSSWICLRKEALHSDNDYSCGQSVCCTYCSNDIFADDWLLEVDGYSPNIFFSVSANSIILPNGLCKQFYFNLI